MDSIFRGCDLYARATYTRVYTVTNISCDPVVILVKCTFKHLAKCDLKKYIKYKQKTELIESDHT